jgi:hypothetical protein
MKDNEFKNKTSIEQFIKESALDPYSLWFPLNVTVSVSVNPSQFETSIKDIFMTAQSPEDLQTFMEDSVMKNNIDSIYAKYIEETTSTIKDRLASDSTFDIINDITKQLPDSDFESQLKNYLIDVYKRTYEEYKKNF